MRLASAGAFQFVSLLIKTSLLEDTNANDKMIRLFGSYKITNNLIACTLDEVGGN